MMRGNGFGTGYMMDGGWLGGGLMLLFGLLVLAGIVLLVIWAVRAAGGHDTGAGMPPSATGHADEAAAIARKRLASGEITPEEFDTIMNALRT